MQELNVPPPEELLGLGQPRYSALDVSERSGLDVEDAKRLWRAMGFVVVPETEVYFTDADLATLTELAGFMAAGFADFETVLGTTRTISQNVGRITDTEVEAIRQELERSPDLARKVLETRGEAAKEAFGSLERFLVHVWRRHLAHALQRSQVLEPQGGREIEMAVGFADIVGFTRLSRDLDEDELESLIERFEALAQDAATAVGGRIVKTIGDEVMFVTDDVEHAAELALAIVDACRETDGDVEVRVGVAAGDLISHHGDYFGPTVNVASRGARAARPNTVLVTEEFARALPAEKYSTKPIPTRRLKGLGNVELYVLRRSSE